VAQADRDEGWREDGLTTDERTELNRLRRENRVLREERLIACMRPKSLLASEAVPSMPDARRIDSTTGLAEM